MDDPEKYQRVEHGDPRQCQSIIAGGQRQCNFRAAEGQNYCTLHGGHDTNTERVKIKNYRLQQWKQRVDEFADHGQVKSLREEIGILRMILEETMTRCQNATELLLQTNNINSLVLNVERLVKSCHQLEERTGFLLDKTAIFNLCDQIVEIIGGHITEESALAVLGQQITLAIMETQGHVKANG